MTESSSLSYKDEDLEKLATLLNGRHQGEEMKGINEADLKREGIVIVFGYSDDNVEFRGAINDEQGAYEGAEFLINRLGLVILDESGSDCDGCIHKFDIKDMSYPLKALWCKYQDYAWAFDTPIDHYTFDIMEDDKKFCQGIVFKLNDIPLPVEYIRNMMEWLKKNDINHEVLNWLDNELEIVGLSPDSDGYDICWKNPIW